MYGRPYEPRRGGGDIQRFFTQGGNPATLILIALNIAVWLLMTFGVGREWLITLIFSTTQWPLPNVWSFVTWPVFAAGHPLWFLFSCLWAFFIGGSLERSWGTRAFVLFLFGTAGLTAFTTYLGAMLLQQSGSLAGLHQAMVAPLVAWAAINRRENVYLYFFPIPAPVMAALGGIILWYEVGAPWLGLFALSGCAFAWWYATQGRYAFRGHSRNSYSNPFEQVTSRRSPFNWGQQNGPRRDAYLRPDTAARFQNLDRESVGQPKGFDPLRWWRERQERKRLEDILRRSGFTDDDQK